MNGWGKNRPRSLGASWGKRKGPPTFWHPGNVGGHFRRVVPHKLTAISAPLKLASSPRLKARQTL